VTTHRPHRRRCPIHPHRPLHLRARRRHRLLLLLRVRRHPIRAKAAAVLPRLLPSQRGLESSLLRLPVLMGPLQALRSLQNLQCRPSPQSPNHPSQLRLESSRLRLPVLMGPLQARRALRPPLLHRRRRHLRRRRLPRRRAVKVVEVELVVAVLAVMRIERPVQETRVRCRILPIHLMTRKNP